MIIDFSRHLRRPPPDVPPGPESGDVPFALREDGSIFYRSRPSLRTADHEIALGASGSGKTIRIISYLQRAMEYEWLHVAPADQMTCIVIDMKSDCCNQALGAILSNPSTRRFADRVSYIDCFARGKEPGAVGLNFVQGTFGDRPKSVISLQLAGLLGSISTGVGSTKAGMGSRQMDLATMLNAAAASGPPESSILWGLDALQANNLKMLASITTDRAARDFLMDADGTLSTELVSSVSSRLRTAFSLYEELENAVGATGAHSCISWESLCKPGQLVLIDLGRSPLPALAQIYGQVFLRMIADHGLSRPSPAIGYNHLKILVDEAQELAEATEDVALRCLAIGRSKQCSLTIASQSTKVLHERAPQLLVSYATNARIRTISRLSTVDAQQWVRDATPPPGVEQSLSAMQGKLLNQVVNLADQECVIMTPGAATRARSLPADVPAWDAALVDPANAELIDAIKRRWSPPAPFPPRIRLTDYVAGHKGNGAKPSRSTKPRSKWG